MGSSRRVSMIVCMFALTFTASSALAETSWTAAGGETTFFVYPHMLSERGLTLQVNGNVVTGDALQKIPFTIGPDATLGFTDSNGRFVAFTGGEVSHLENLVIQSATGQTVTVEGFSFDIDAGSSPAMFRPTFKEKVSGKALLEMTAAKAGFYLDRNALQLEGAGIQITEELAALLGDKTLAGVTLGDVRMSMPVAWAGGDEPTPYEPPTPSPEGAPRGGNNGTVCPQPVGPDVMTGVISGIGNYNNSEIPPGSGNWFVGFSVGTTSCNIGNFMVLWDDDAPPPTNLHPVIAQNFYRLRTMTDGTTRFEQIGQSWLKHGFTVAAGDSCGCGCTGPGGPQLHPGCSDPYGAGLNGSQSNLGPRWQVNARTGEFPHPYQDGTHVPGDTNTWKRIMVRASDLAVANSLFFAEGHYIAPDDHQAGNASNNASYIRITVTPAGANNYSASSSGFQTIRELPAIRAWKAAVPSVVETDIVLNPGAGESFPNAHELMILAANVTPLPGGKWNYEYALYNMHSHRAARSFSVPVGNSAVLENVGFNNVLYHSGDGEGGVTRSNNAWSWTHEDGVLTWSTQTFAENPNANALNWGVMFNFRFTCNIAPAEANGEATIGLFRPGTPTSINASTVVPEPAPLYLVFEGPAPTTVLGACEPVSFDIDVLDGSDVYSPGTAMLHYSIDDAPYVATPLSLISGTLHRATLPAIACGQSMKFYIRAQAAGGEFVTEPENAPTAAFAPQVGTEVVNTVLQTDFEAGMPLGWNATGFWSATSACPVAPVCNGNQWAYYGQVGTCNYETGTTANSGSLTTSVTIPSTRLAQLTYCSNFQRENFAMSDWPTVKVNGTVVDAPAQGGRGSSPWEVRTVDLSAYAGQTVNLEWNFSTLDGFGNNFRGWQIDDVKLTAIEVSCLGGDINRDGRANAMDLQAFVSALMAQSTVSGELCAADFSSSGVIDLDDIADMVNALLN